MMTDLNGDEAEDPRWPDLRVIADLRAKLAEAEVALGEHRRCYDCTAGCLNAVEAGATISTSGCINCDTEALIAERASGEVADAILARIRVEARADALKEAAVEIERQAAIPSTVRWTAEDYARVCRKLADVGEGGT